MHPKRLLTSIAILLAACSSSAETVEVRIEKMLFTPDVIRVKPGDTVLWKNTEVRGYHTVWFQPEKIEESPPLFPDDSWQRTFTTPGEYPYNCGPHPWMTGRVIVE